MNTTLRTAFLAVAAVGALSLAACKSSGDTMDPATPPASSAPATESTMPASDSSTMPADSTTTTPPADGTTTTPTPTTP